MTPPAQTKSAPEFSKDTIKAAIAEGRAVIKDGKTKIEAAMAIYKKLRGADRETVVAAFVEGAGLTQAGAVTYWYNCRRKSSKGPKAD